MGLNIGARHISVSTSGLVPGIYRLADENIHALYLFLYMLQITKKEVVWCL